MLSFNRQFWFNTVLFVVACVVLGLSIWALVAKCPENFGSSCLPVLVKNCDSSQILNSCNIAKQQCSNPGFVNCNKLKGTDNSCDLNLGDDYSTGCYVVGDADMTFGEDNVINCH